MAEPTRVTALVPALLAHDEDALRQLVDYALPRLMRIAEKTGASPLDAEEAAMDAIYRPLSKLAHLDFTGSKAADPLFSYMAQTAKHSAQEKYRKQLRERNAFAMAVGGAADDPDIASLDARTHPTSNAKFGDQSAKSIWAEPVTEDGVVDLTDPQRQFLDTLTADERELALLWARSPEDTWEEIALQLGIAAATARQRWSRLRKKAERHLQHQEASDASPV